MTPKKQGKKGHRNRLEGESQVKIKTYKPKFIPVPGTLHSCVPTGQCMGCNLELLQTLKYKQCRFVWMVKSRNECDIRRYAFTHKQAVEQLAHLKGKFGQWLLYKLVRVNRRKP